MNKTFFLSTKKNNEIITEESFESLLDDLFQSEYEPVSYGYVERVKDGVAFISGYENSSFSELVSFVPSSARLSSKSSTNNVDGMVVGIESNYITVIILGNERLVKEGDRVFPKESIVSVPVGMGLLGRVIDPLGNPIDDPKNKININKSPIDNLYREYYVGKRLRGYQRPVEIIAPGIIVRKSVSQPLLTGINAVDSMVPIGLGQRELIIGDRQTGKTAIAIDTILNQAFLNELVRNLYYLNKENTNALLPSKVCYCIYVGIGQKQSTISRIVQNLHKSRTLFERKVDNTRPIYFSALKYSIVVASISSDAAPLQFLAPYTGCTIGEFFRDNGSNAVIIYDDLSKQAVAYRQMSLLLRRPPGREAYPGDVFYLHSRLLERAAKYSDEKGAGSLTALPIIETQAGDVSAYIPTNVISITDGQIYLEQNLFNAGMRPALNVGISVSRVGGAAQIKAMKKVAGPLKLELAMYRELESFAKFGSDLDKSTQQQLTRGSRLTEILKQGQYQPIPIEKQVVLIVSATSGHLDTLPLESLRRYEDELFTMLDTQHKDLLEKIRIQKALTDEINGILNPLIKEFTESFKRTLS